MINEENMRKLFLDNLAEHNCNCRLVQAQSRRDKVSALISSFVAKGYNIDGLEQEYNVYCDIIEELCKFRRTHKCLLQGDPGYKFN